MSRHKLKFEHAEQPAGGWGSAEAIRERLWREHERRDRPIRLGFKGRDQVIATTVANDNILREVAGLRITPYDIPDGCVAVTIPN